MCKKLLLLAAFMATLRMGGIASLIMVADETELIVLPAPIPRGEMSLEETLAKRRSVRRFDPRALTTNEVAQLLWAVQGITNKTRGYRTAPSAGATYPLTTYLLTQDGLWRYLPERHALQPLQKKDLRRALSEAALGQEMVAAAPAVIVLAAEKKRTTSRYGQRGEMYVHMEAGHAAQNLHLQAVALKLGSVAVGAFDPERVAALLKLPNQEIPLYILPVGEPAD